MELPNDQTRVKRVGIKTITVTIGLNQWDWIQKHKGNINASPSFLMKKALNEAMEREGDVFFETRLETKRKLEVWKENSIKARNFIEKRGLIDEFLEKG